MLLLPCLQPAEAAEVIQGATGARSDSLEVHAGGLVVREGEAGSTFGLVQAGRAKRQLSYFILFKHRPSAAAPLESSEEATAEGDAGSSRQALTSDGKSLQIDYQVQLDPASKKVSRESLTLNKKSVDLARGRVLLVDLTASPPRWEQVKVDLPTEPGEATTGKAAAELVRKVLGGAATRDRKIKEFLEAARK
jgi:hypothetical protein